MNNDPIRVLVVDDTVTYRKIVSDILADHPAIEVVGVAANGKIALTKIEHLKPDILTLDLEMPEMDGLEVLKWLQEKKSTVGAIMLSAFTNAGAKSTVEALKLGAFDFVLKPTCDNLDDSRKQLASELCPKIEAYGRKLQVSNILSNNRESSPAERERQSSESEIPKQNLVQRVSSFKTGKVSPEIVVLGISTGGPQSLNVMLPQLPLDLSVPVVIVQHMPPMFTKSLADDLNKKCKLTVTEAVEGESVEPGKVLIAPGGKQMKIIKNSIGGKQIKITDDPPENSCRPSVDYLFRSAAHLYNGNALGVIMTGMGSDGTLGCKLLKRQGAIILTQDEESCVVYGMPKGPADEGISDIVAPLNNIATEITRLTRQGAVV